MMQFAGIIVWKSIHVCAHSEYGQDIDFVFANIFGESDPFLHEICDFAIDLWDRFEAIREMNRLTIIDALESVVYKGARGLSAVKAYYLDYLERIGEKEAA